MRSRKGNYIVCIQPVYSVPVYMDAFKCFEDKTGNYGCKCFFPGDISVAQFLSGNI